jgi:hypothetical protein
MFNTAFSFDPVEMNLWSIMVCTLVSFAGGILTALVYGFRNTCQKGFVAALALLPAIIQAIIMLVNGNVGTGIAVMGAFNLVRLRSIPATAKEMASIILAMALGLAAGTGHIWYALVFALVINGVMLLLTLAGFGEIRNPPRSLKIVIPEDLDYPRVFKDLLTEYTGLANLERVRTVNFGSLYELRYTIRLKDPEKEKELIDKLRERNSNLEISCGPATGNREEL